MHTRSNHIDKASVKAPPVKNLLGKRSAANKVQTEALNATEHLDESLQDKYEESKNEKREDLSKDGDFFPPSGEDQHQSHSDDDDEDGATDRKQKEKTKKRKQRD